VILRIYLSDNDRYKGKTAHSQIIEFLRDSGISGATALHGIEGYGVHSKIHTASILRLSEDLPVIVEAVDTEENIRPIIPKLRQMVPGELITLEDVEVVAGENI
jgi:PII-like signaling protein